MRASQKLVRCSPMPPLPHVLGWVGGPATSNQRRTTVGRRIHHPGSSIQHRPGWPGAVGSLAPIGRPGCLMGDATGRPTTAPRAGCRLSQCWDHRRHGGAALPGPNIVTGGTRGERAGEWARRGSGNRCDRQAGHGDGYGDGDGMTGLRSRFRLASRRCVLILGGEGRRLERRQKLGSGLKPPGSSVS